MLFIWIQKIEYDTVLAELEPSRVFHNIIAMLDSTLEKYLVSDFISLDILALKMLYKKAVLDSNYILMGKVIF